MHPVFVQEQYFAHLPEQSDVQESGATVILWSRKTHDSVALCSKTQEQYEQTKFQQSHLKILGWKNK